MRALPRLHLVHGPTPLVKRPALDALFGLDLWIKRDDAEEEIVVNTANFTRLIEKYVRRYPDQWLWVHRRWKTRPAEEPPLYPV